MKQFKVEDMLLGFHFSFKFISPVSPVRKPLIASVHIESEVDEMLSCYGKDYIFSVSSEGNVYEVNAQLIWDMNFDSSSTIAVRISDRYDNALLEVPVHAFWLQRQKEKLLTGCAVDRLKCGVYNPVQMEKICVDEEKYTSLFWIRRLGKKIGNETDVSVMQVDDYKSMMLHKEFDKFRNWMLQYTSYLEAGFLSGHHFLPVYSILCMADARDEWSFAHQGWIQTKLPHKIWVQSWKKEWNDIVKLTSLFHCKEEKQFWKVVDLICCNSSSTQKDLVNKKRFPYPRFNSSIRNQVDFICSRMLIIDMLYKLPKRKESIPMCMTDDLAKKWPCIAVAKTVENELVLLCGLLDRSLLNSIVIQSRLKGNTLLHLHPEITERVRLVMMSWHDYTEGVMCTALLLDEFTREIGVECVPHGEHSLQTTSRDGRSEIYVTKYRTVAQLFKHAFHMNGPRALRPILSVSQLLLDIDIKSKKYFSWHQGYVTETRSFWTKEHVLSTFDASRCIITKKLTIYLG